MIMVIFKDRAEAGRMLAEKLSEYKGREDAVVCGITRGGVVVAAEVARILSLPLLPVVMKKIGAPFNKEFAIGSVDADGNVYLSDEAMMITSSNYIEEEAERLRDEIKEKLEYYGVKGEVVERMAKGKVCIVVDDGVATGLTTVGASNYLKRKGAKKVVLAVPVAPAESADKLKEHFDEVVVVHAPQQFYAVSQFYRNFEQVSDEEVRRILEELKS